MKHEGSLCSQKVLSQSQTLPYSQLKSLQHIYLRSILILSSCLCLNLTSGLLSWKDHTHFRVLLQMLHVQLISSFLI